MAKSSFELKPLFWNTGCSVQAGLSDVRGGAGQSGSIRDGPLNEECGLDHARVTELVLMRQVECRHRLTPVKKQRSLLRLEHTPGFAPGNPDGQAGWVQMR